MSRSPAPVASIEAVPVADRLRVTQYLRLAAVGLVLLMAAVAPTALAPGMTLALTATAYYGGAVVLGEVAARLLRSQVVVVFSGLLIVDGVWLAWVSYLTGGTTSPLRYLVLLHLGAVSLLASYRTGLKLAMWHSLLLFATSNAVQGQVLDATGPVGTVRGIGGTDAQRLAVFVVVLWLVAVSTSALSAVNERELRRRRMDLEALTDLAMRLERTTDSKSAALTLLDTAVDTFGFARGVVVAGPEGQLPLLASFGLDDLTARRPGRPGPSSVIALAQTTRQTQLVTGLDPASDPWLTRLLPEARNVVVVPLSAENRSLGALVLEHEAKAGPRIQRRIVASLERSASYAALALRNAWLLEQVQRLAATDGLTKIANRRTFEATLDREVARATRAAEHVSLVMLDIDHFKLLNDTQGHQAGDEVLRNVAAALSCECRDFDTAARYGGEEFAVVLPGCGPEEAFDIAERLRQAVAAAPSVVPITASAGVATYPGHAGDADTLVRAADDALYRSKNAGRDRTTVSPGIDPEVQVDAVLRRAVAERLGRDGGPTVPQPTDGGPSSPRSAGASGARPPRRPRRRRRRPARARPRPAARRPGRGRRRPAPARVLRAGRVPGQEPADDDGRDDGAERPGERAAGGPGPAARGGVAAAQRVPRAAAAVEGLLEHALEHLRAWAAARRCRATEPRRAAGPRPPRRRRAPPRRHRRPGRRRRQRPARARRPGRRPRG